MVRRSFTILTLVLAAFTTVWPQTNQYPWLTNYDSLNSIVCLIKVPDGCRRIEVEEGSFANWLRHLPLRKGQSKIYLYDGTEVTTHGAGYAVVDIDTGKKDLQQCGDAVIRFQAEHLYSKKMFDSISFIFTSGDTARYSDWRSGFRPIVKSDKVDWEKSAEADSSYESFREYLDSVFMYAGTYSLSREMKQVNSVDSLRIGDSFVLGGFPGHAVVVADLAVDSVSGQKLFLLIQSYTPAQDIHLIKNPDRANGLPWFEMQADDTLKILYWQFTERHLRRF